VYATGFGSGGGMVGRLACELNHRIAAIADVEGFIGCIPDNPMPTLIMFGTADPFVPYEGGGLFPPVRGFVDNWAAANGCSGMPTETDLPDINTADSSTVTLLKYNDCAAGGETLFYRINNGGRSHPGADPMDYPPEILAQIGNINQDINASSEIWNFFNRHELSESTSVETVTPATFNLRVFPNPASTQVTFSFALPQSARVQLTLHNAIGQRVQTLHDGQLPQGEQQFTWQNDGLPAGTYFYRLRVNDQITSAPVILVR
jgi:polyhydroxybutyrate depolymerase